MIFIYIMGKIKKLFYNINKTAAAEKPLLLLYQILPEMGSPYFMAATRSNSSVISFAGALVARLNTMIIRRLSAKPTARE